MARPRPQLVYINRFGSHRCGSVIRYGQGSRHAEAARAGSQLSTTGEAMGLRATMVPGDKASPELSTTTSRARAAGSCGGARPASRHCESLGPGTSGSRGEGDLRDTNADTFDFPFPSRNVDKVIKQKKKKSKVWLKVSKVISKMLEENEKFRNRLLACSQFNGEGNAMNQSSQNEASYLDREETIFGWV